MEQWIGYIVAIITGISATIPLVYKLIKYVKLAINEKNWKQMMDLTLALMDEAQHKFDHGPTRKEWVLGMVATAASKIKYDVDLNAIGDLIDSIVKVSKVVGQKTVSSNA